MKQFFKQKEFEALVYYLRVTKKLPKHVVVNILMALMKSLHKKK